MTLRVVAVAGCCGSGVLCAIAVSTAAASATVRVCGPTVSCVWLIGTTPPRLVRPTVGLMPTTPFMLAGHTMLPSVSLPMLTAVKVADGAARPPELLPHALGASAERPLPSPALPHHALVAQQDAKF